MELTKDGIRQKYAKQCGKWKRNYLLPCGFDVTCVACGYNVIKRKHGLSKISLKKINFIN